MPEQSEPATPWAATVRGAEEQDFEHLVELWQALSEAGNTADGRYRLRNDARRTAARFIAEEWLGHDVSHRAWVAVVEDGAIVGFIATRTAEPHPVLDQPLTLVISDAFVAEAYRRQGVGRALVAAVREHAANEGTRAIEVGTLALDARAVAFWRSLGFDDWRVLLRSDT
jgi:ribosomal protein S18 acetylase RimI-like enzyme